MDQLFLRFIEAQVQPVADVPAHQQCPVPAQDDPVFCQCLPDEFGIVDRVLIAGVETEQTKMSRQPAQLRIGEETGFTQW